MHHASHMNRERAMTPKKKKTKKGADKKGYFHFPEIENRGKRKKEEERKQTEKKEIESKGRRWKEKRDRARRCE